MKAIAKKYILDFKRPGGTSRGVLTTKETWFIILEEGANYGIGECGIFRGLSVDDVPDYEQKIKWVCTNIHLGLESLLLKLQHYPSIQFGLEQAFLSFASGDPYILFPSSFTEKDSPIPINGLIWMGDEAFMLSQIEERLEDGFNCLKMKIGSIDFQKEIDILKSIRKRFSAQEVELRVDANGAFSEFDASDKLASLAEFTIHSIEQPIAPRKAKVMRTLCQNTPIPIALDEELIGIFEMSVKKHLLESISPQYIILKPSLVGGYAGCLEWITIADTMGIQWWITSALESNIGLNAIAQWTYSLGTTMPQGLGTGSLFTNNFKSPLEVDKGQLFYRKSKSWDNQIKDRLCL